MTTSRPPLVRVAVSAAARVPSAVRLPGVDVASSVLASTVRGWRGSMLRTRQPEPVFGLTLYDFEGCPYCRIVRETLSELDLDADIRPCPAGGTRFRPEAERIGGKQQFPLLVADGEPPLYESADIIAWLYARYGHGAKPPAEPRALALATGQAASLLRGLGGIRARTSRAPAQPLVLFSFESSPYSRRVRERLCELELPYRLRNFGKARATDIGPPWVRTRFFPDAPIDSHNRQELLDKTGRTQVPYLEDPNTGAALFESDAIIGYLESTYAG